MKAREEGKNERKWRGGCHRSRKELKREREKPPTCPLIWGPYLSRAPARQWNPMRQLKSLLSIYIIGMERRLLYTVKQRRLLTK